MLFRRLSIAAALALASCTPLDNFPLIRPDPASITPGFVTNLLTANITQRGAPIDAALTVVCEVDLQISATGFRPLPPVAATRGTGNQFRCLLPPNLSVLIRRNMNIRTRWQVFSPRPNQAPLKVAESPHVETLLGCPNRAAALAAMQAAAFASLPPKITLVPPGSPVGTPAPPPTFTRDEIIGAGFIPTHGAASFQGMGVAFIRADATGSGAAASVTGMEFGVPNAARPDLLLFAPRPGTITLTDVLGFDEPYTLVGWAFAQTIDRDHAVPIAPTGAKASLDLRPDQRRPTLACVAHHEWFIHSQGVHKFDGSFAPVPPVNINIANPDVGLPHGPLWDVHMFISPSGVPEVGIRRSGAQATLLGIPFNPAGFYAPTAYD